MTPPPSPDRDETETWWVEIRIWPVAVRIEADVLLETRGLPGMRDYQCGWNDIIALLSRMRRRL